jgi:hypothetical protein
MAGVSNSKKQKKSKRPKKGVRYIAQKLRKYYPKRYKNFNEALVKARTIKSELDLRSDEKTKRVNLRNIFSIERIPKKPKDVEPQIPDLFYEAKNYFEIIDVPFKISTQLPDNVYVESKISKENLPLLKGMTDNEEKYKEATGNELEDDYFKDFIDYGNELQKLSDNQYPMFFVFLPPIRKNGKWVMYLVSSDDEGIKCDYGFDPQNPKTPTDIFVCPDNFEDMPYNSLRTEAKKRGIKTKTPTKAELIKLLKEDNKKKQPEQSPKKDKKTDKPEKSEKLELEKEKTKQMEAEAKILSEKNKQRELDLREQELDMEKIQWGAMTVAEFKKKWGK